MTIKDRKGYKVIIMAGGVGNRLLPLTETMPKCLLQIGGRTVLEHQLAALQLCGLEDIVIVTGHGSKEIEKRLGGHVTFIYNKDYRMTNSAYGLWLVRDLIKDGFIYINSDLLFHPNMLTNLLASSYEDAIIVDHILDISRDMKKAQMDGDRILNMSKEMGEDIASAEAVGPVMLSKKGARWVIDTLNILIEKGEMNHWAYEIFNLYAKDHDFYGVYNRGDFWSEIDTRSDLNEANNTIPSDFPFPAVTDYNTSFETKKVERDLAHNPLEYLDSITGSSFASLLKKIPRADEIVRHSLEKNAAQFSRKIEYLHLAQNTPAALYDSAQVRIKRIEKQLSDYFGHKHIHDFDELKEIVKKLFTIIPTELKRNWYLKESSARALLLELPPATMVKFSSAKTVGELIRYDNPLTVLAMTRFTEPEIWQAKYHMLFTQMTADDFESRSIEPAYIDVARFKNAITASKQPLKPWRTGHSKETGRILCLSVDDASMFATPLTLYVLIFFHYFYETMYPSHFYQQVAKENPQGVGECVVNSFVKQKERFPGFSLNIYSENLYWKKALELFYKNFPSVEADFYKDTTSVGEYIETGDRSELFSLNIVDQLWNANFSGQNSLDASIFLNTTLFSYHFRQELWHAVLQTLSGLEEKYFDKAIVENLGDSDVAFTKKLLSTINKEHG